MYGRVTESTGRRVGRKNYPQRSRNARGFAESNYHKGAYSMIKLGKYITKSGHHVEITSVTPTKAYGKITGAKTFEAWEISGTHTDPEKTIVRKA